MDMTQTLNGSAPLTSPLLNAIAMKGPLSASLKSMSKFTHNMAVKILPDSLD